MRIVLFDGKEESFSGWVNHTKLFLNSMNIFDIVDGSNSCPNPLLDPKGAAHWKRCDQSAAGQIIGMIEDVHQSLVNKIPDPGPHL